jgi:hypothetical protein
VPGLLDVTPFQSLDVTIFVVEQLNRKESRLQHNFKISILVTKLNYLSYLELQTTNIPPVDLYLIFEKSSLKNQI